MPPPSSTTRSPNPTRYSICTVTIVLFIIVLIICSERHSVVVAQTVPGRSTVPAHAQTVHVARLADVEELVHGIFGVPIKVTHVHSQRGSGSSCGETVHLVQTKPVLSVKLAESSYILCPPVKKVYGPVHPPLYDHPRSTGGVHVAGDVEGTYCGAPRVNAVDTTPPLSSVIHLRAVTREGRVCGGRGGGEVLNSLKSPEWLGSSHMLRFTLAKVHNSS